MASVTGASVVVGVSAETPTTTEAPVTEAIADTPSEEKPEAVKQEEEKKDA